ncbi:MAG: HicB family protein [Peptococcaceae bacterium]|nr:HicB family protein [Peptococcaceae bacterium]
MKKVYPVILTPSNIGYVVYVPDLDINTQGTDLANAIDMARDAIGLWGITEQDMGRSIPEPSLELPGHEPNQIATLVDIDFDAYRRANDNRTIRKNLTIPSWLNIQAEKAGVNFSQILQDALKERLGIQ